jgi:hypothetical protein
MDKTFFYFSENSFFKKKNSISSLHQRKKTSFPSPVSGWRNKLERFSLKLFFQPQLYELS